MHHFATRNYCVMLTGLCNYDFCKPRTGLSLPHSMRRINTAVQPARISLELYAVYLLAIFLQVARHLLQPCSNCLPRLAGVKECRLAATR
jgi:hypothetical protein